MFTLHLLGIPHTITDLRFSHCAFTQKVVRFIPMMRAQGCRVIHYGVGPKNPGADMHVEVVTEKEQVMLLGHDHQAAFSGSHFYGDDADVGNLLYREFNKRLRTILMGSVQPNEFVCLPFGHAHQEGVSEHRGINIETGIGYPTTFERYRIFESYAWLHRLGGAAKREGTDYEWVIPNYFDVAQWPLFTGERAKRLVFLGRIGQIKGLDVIRAIAEYRPDLEIVICGQGDASPWLDSKVPNLVAIPPIMGLERAAYLGNALALLAPTHYIEPFCGVTVEANLCGTPALTSHFGAFSETIQPNLSGQRCRTLGDWLAAVAWAEWLNDEHYADIAAFARAQYSMEALGPKYLEVFQQITDVHTGKGWYTLTSKIGEAVSTKVEPVVTAELLTMPVTEQRWQDAQHYEREYWLSGGPERKAIVDEREREQHVFYRGLMRIAPATVNGKSVLDIGCGPYSIGLDADLQLQELVAVDPAHYHADDEAVYMERSNVIRIYEKVEDLQVLGGADEIWCYNLLQHVVDPAKCIAVAAALAKSTAFFRIFEWCNVPPDQGHPHVLTKKWLCEQLTLAGFEVWKEMSGMEQVTGWKATEFYAAVWVRKE